MRDAQPILLVDVDDTVGDLRNYHRMIGIKLWGQAKTRAEVDALPAEERAPFLAELERLRPCRDLRPLPGAVEAITEAKASGWDVMFVTSYLRDSAFWVKDRDQWLGDTFGPGFNRRAIHTPHKEYVDGHVFVDDLPHQVKKWKRDRPDGVAILFDHEENQGVEVHPSILRRSSWDAISVVLRTLMDREQIMRKVRQPWA